MNCWHLREMQSILVKFSLLYPLIPKPNIRRERAVVSMKYYLVTRSITCYPWRTVLILHFLTLTCHSQQLRKCSYAVQLIQYKSNKQVWCTVMGLTNCSCKLQTDKALRHRTKGIGSLLEVERPEWFLMLMNLNPTPFVN